MEKQPDYYSLLGVARKATPDEIRRAYRKKVFQYHPDRNPDDRGAADKLKEVLEAYEVLSNEVERARYDKATWTAFQDDNGDQREETSTGPRFSYQFKQKLEPEPQCPRCAAVGTDQIISRKAGSGSAKGKQFVTSPFQIIFCAACGHVYGVTGHTS